MITGIETAFNVWGEHHKQKMCPQQDRYAILWCFFIIRNKIQNEKEDNYLLWKLK